MFGVWAGLGSPTRSQYRSILSSFGDSGRSVTCDRRTELETLYNPLVISYWLRFVYLLEYSWTITGPDLTSIYRP